MKIDKICKVWKKICKKIWRWTELKYTGEKKVGENWEDVKQLYLDDFKVYCFGVIILTIIVLTIHLVLRYL
jgi:hypothetical protein